VTDSHDLAAAHVLDAIAGDELSAYKKHLASCASCQREVLEMREAVGSMALALAVTPPSDLRSKIVQSLPASTQTSPQRRRPRWAWVAAAAAFGLAVVFGAFLATTTAKLTEAEQIANVYAASDANVVPIVSSQIGPGRFTYSVVKAQGVFVGWSMPQPASDHIYQFWLIGSDGPIPSGTFTPEADGSVSALVEGGVHPGLVLGITEEPTGGSEQPTGDVLLATDL